MASPTSSNNSPWAALLPAALAGTARTASPPNLPGLTPSLGTEAHAAEKQLLLTAAGLALVQRVGRRPATGPSTWPRHLAPESWPAADPAAAAVLLAELSKNPIDSFFLLHLVDLLHAGRRRVPYGVLPTLLRYEPRNSGKLLAAYGAVLGSRGAWLAELGLGGRLDAGAMAGAQPASSTPTQRQAYWANLLEHASPEHLPELLAYQLPLESPATREQLLWALWGRGQEHWLPPTAHAQLTKLLAAHPAAARSWHHAATPYENQVQARLADSPAQERYWARAQAWLQLERPAAGAPRLLLSPPAAWHPTWGEDGLTEKPSYVAAHQNDVRYDWLKTTLTAISPRRWAAAWNLSADALAQVATTDDTATVLGAWIAAAIRTQDAEYLRPLLAVAPSPLTTPFLLRDLWGLERVLPPAEWLAYLRRFRPADPDQPGAYAWLRWCEMLSYLPPALVEDLLPLLLPHLRQPAVPGHSSEGYLLLHHLGRAADLAAGPLLAAALSPLLHEAPWYAAAIRQALERVQQRQALVASLGHPATPAEKPS